LSGDEKAEILGRIIDGDTEGKRKKPVGVSMSGLRDVIKKERKHMKMKRKGKWVRCGKGKC
jgi:hypothetical protein